MTTRRDKPAPRPPAKPPAAARLDLRCRRRRRSPRRRRRRRSRRRRSRPTRRAPATSKPTGAPTETLVSAPADIATAEPGSRRIWLSGATGFVGKAVARMLRMRGDVVIAPVRDRRRAEELLDMGVTVLEDDLSDVDQITETMRDVDGAIHAAGSYRVGITREERGAMWDANIGTTTRFLDAAEAAKVPRVLYVSTVGIFGNTRGQVVDETYRRNIRDGFASWYDETKFGAHEVVLQRTRTGAPIISVLPSQVYGPGDHFAIGEQLALAHAGKLPYRALEDVGPGVRPRRRPRGRYRRRPRSGRHGSVVRVVRPSPSARRCAGDRGAPRRQASPAADHPERRAPRPRAGWKAGRPGEHARGRRFGGGRHLLGIQRAGRPGARLASARPRGGPEGHVRGARWIGPTLADRCSASSRSSSRTPAVAATTEPPSRSRSRWAAARSVAAADGSNALRRHPDWIRAKLPSGENYHDLKRLLRGLNLNTVCEEAHCPNIGECWDQRTATIMILGDTCTRACGFCNVKTGRPTWFDDDEPRRVAEAISGLGLEHVVVTSVARDDLPDGGAHVFAETIRQLRERVPGMGVEVLIPDFNGEEAPLRDVMAARPDILNHNLETVRRLQKPVRKRARWDRTLGVLSRAKAYAAEAPYAVHTKSSLMVGLGETRDELTRGVRCAPRGRLRHPHDRPVPAAVAQAPAARALLPPRRVRRDEDRGARARLQARRVRPARALQLPRPRPGSRRRAARAPTPPGHPRRRRPGHPPRRLT